MRSVMLATLLAGALVVSQGCCGVCGPCNQGCFDSPPCGMTCGATCGAACSPCDEGCGPCGDCGPCGYGACEGGPIRWVLGVLGIHCGGCDGGCGECYRGDWCSDPPACDPCDRCGNYMGGGAAEYAPGSCPTCGGQASMTRQTPNRAVASAPRKTAQSQAVRQRSPYASQPAQYATQPAQYSNQPVRYAKQPARQAGQYVGEPKVISETDEVVSESVEEGVTPTAYQAKPARQIDYRR